MSTIPSPPTVAGYVKCLTTARVSDAPMSFNIRRRRLLLLCFKHFAEGTLMPQIAGHITASEYMTDVLELFSRIEIDYALNEFRDFPLDFWTTGTIKNW